MAYLILLTVFALAVITRNEIKHQPKANLKVSIVQSSLGWTLDIS